MGKGRQRESVVALGEGWVACVCVEQWAALGEGECGWETMWLGEQGVSGLNNSVSVFK